MKTNDHVCNIDTPDRKNISKMHGVDMRVGVGLITNFQGIRAGLKSQNRQMVNTKMVSIHYTVTAKSLHAAKCRKEAVKGLRESETWCERRHVV